MPGKRKSESGQVVVLATAAIFIIMGIAALVVDIGFLYATRRNMQTAADAAAIAGSNALEQACATTSGCTCNGEAVCAAAGADVATLNGYTNGGANSMSVTVATPSTPPANPAGGIFVQATVSEAVPTFFMRVVGFPTVSVGATAIAGYAPVGPCMTATDPTDSKTINVSGSASVNSGCEIIDESTNSDGLNVSGSATVTAGAIALVASSWSGNGGHAGSVMPTPSTNTAIPPNPYANLVPPSQCSPSGGCNAPCQFGTATTPFHATSSQTISQGVYCGGIQVSGGASLTLNPGVYILVGGGGDMVSGNATMTGTGGVTFYNTYSAANPYRGISLSGTSTTTLSAPTTGAYANILFYQDPSVPITGNSSNGSSITGTSGANFTGALYFPTTQLTFSGGSATAAANVNLYAYQIVITGNSFLGQGTANPGQSPPITTSRLYE